ncbi:hypothetical protein ACN38_g11811, partial [Penicillium nordicum]
TKPAISTICAVMMTNCNMHFCMVYAVLEVT